MKQNLYDNPEFFAYYSRLRASKLTYNDFVEQPAFRSLLPSLQGKRVLDLGCGSGQLATYMLEQGAAHVTGTDISASMLSLAPQHEQIEYIQAPMEQLDFPGNHFDIIVSSLALHYVEQYEAMIRKIAHWLRAGGTFVFSTEHPLVTAKLDKEGWVENEQGERLYYVIDQYSQEGIRRSHWVVDDVITYHRRLSTLMNGVIQSGLRIEAVIEPEPTAEGLEKMPQLVDELRKPSFIVIGASK
ncbi:class I SAM-dependent methyltransferase [Paenibacillus campi]|uniref:class I SAM-dependent methyltransferase n=1 Tax=Paenibacillus campi TaxID=3106031 RepID=UPI002B0023C1|nr:class I SAM-dependent methyltransferase [Paenibacillus sp. SGZ-1014]